MPLTREQMFERVLASDSTYNGVFFTGVLSTGIYCLPSCKARKPKPENVRFFDSVDSAREAGLRACKKCHPDEFADGIDPQGSWLEPAMNKMRLGAGEIPGPNEFADLLQVSPSTLYKLIRKHYHTTPGELLIRAKVEKAKRLLLTSSNSVTEIAFEVGFESLSTFYEHFGRLLGMPPINYRKLENLSEFDIQLPEDFFSDAVLAYFGRDKSSLSERVIGSTIQVGVQLSRGPAQITITLDGTVVHCHVGKGDGVEAHALVTRMLGLNQDPSGFELHVRKHLPTWLPERKTGLRLPQTPTPFDGVIWAIVGQQVNLPFAYTLRRRLVELAGEKVSDDLWAPPTPAKVSRLRPDDLLPLQFSNRKAEYLIGVSQQIAIGALDLVELESRSAMCVERELLSIRGFGPWSTHYLMMRSLGFADCVPIGDTGLTSALQRAFKLEVRPNAEQTSILMEPFSPYRSLATFHHWQSLKFES